MSRAHEKLGERQRTESQDIISTYGGNGKERAISQLQKREFFPRDGNALQRTNTNDILNQQIAGDQNRMLSRKFSNNYVLLTDQERTGSINDEDPVKFGKLKSRD